ncbi:proton-coupled folate transporter-like [Pectinophora gossypiella]|nr:proton-coupled folate transporter-like [Pectinophora gossypiella]
MVTREEEPLKSKPEQKKSLREKYQYIKENITVEPVLACYVVPGMLARLATQNLYLDKACRVNINYGDKICSALVAKEGNLYQDEERAVQELIAGMDVWKNILLTSIPSFLILFLGAWSDRTGKRKICILLPIIGDLLMCISNIINVYFFYELPVQVTMFFEAFFPAVTGGWIATYMGAFSYISDVSSEESRTFRVGVANLCLTAGSPIGSALSGILLKQIGYYGVFTLSSILYIFSIFYGFFYIKDPERPVQKKKDENESTGCFAFLKSFFAIKHVKDTLTIGFKEGPNNRRIKSILVMLAIAFIYGPAYGEYTVRYLFCRSRFNWDALKYSFYNTFYICVHSVGALISISVFSRRFGWDDSTLGIISNVSKIAGGLATGLARTSTQMYFAVAIETFNATSFTALRSISSKLVSSDELGKMISLFNLMEIVTSMVFGPIYSWVYMVTVAVDTGVVYYISTAMTFAPVFIFWWFFKENRKMCREKREKQTQLKALSAKEEA